jgi:Trypsin-co-occurring domain 1
VSRECEHVLSFREKIRAVDMRGGWAVMYVVEMPVEGGGVLRLQATEDDIPLGLVPAANPLDPGTLVTKTSETIQAALDGLTPAITATTKKLRKLAADEVTVEFGLVLGVEGGVIVAKGSAEVHFTVTLTWKHPEKNTAAAPTAAAETPQAPKEPAVPEKQGG